MSDGDQYGWVVADEPAQGRSPRYYLVAATGPAQALLIAQAKLGDGRSLVLRGPADAAHLERREMQLGDVLEIRSANRKGTT